jgi:YidC/Oxa1 family membrane protein insertase
LNPWELIIQQPVINVLIVMSHYLADNFGLAIIALTIIVNLLMLGLTLRQLRSTKAMQEMQPRLAELQKKYGKDRQKMAQEQMRLYKESGVKPAGCAITMIIQMPVWIALYQSIMLTLAVAPEGLLNLSKYLYSWPIVYSVLPLSRDFLWFNLAEPDLFLAILVGATMWLQQKMSMTMPADPKQRSQSQMMLWMMPLMFAFLALSFPSGLSLFWATSSIVRIVLQYRVTGWGGLTREAGKEVAEDKKYLKFVDPTEGKSLDAAGADIVITDTQEKPSKMRYLPGRDRAQRRRKR